MQAIIKAPDEEEEEEEEIQIGSRIELTVRQPRAASVGRGEPGAASRSLASKSPHNTHPGHSNLEAVCASRKPTI